MPQRNLGSVGIRRWRARDTLQGVAAAGKPMAVVLLNRSALSVNWMQDSRMASACYGCSGREPKVSDRRTSRLGGITDIKANTAKNEE